MVDNPKGIFRSYSFWSMAAGLLMLAQELVPVWEGVVDDNTFTIMGSVALSLGIIGRFIDQGIAKPRDD